MFDVLRGVVRVLFVCVRDESRAASEQTIPCHEVWRCNVHVPLQLEGDVSGVNSRENPKKVNGRKN